MRTLLILMISILVYSCKNASDTQIQKENVANADSLLQAEIKTDSIKRDYLYLFEKIDSITIEADTAELFFSATKSRMYNPYRRLFAKNISPELSLIIVSAVNDLYVEQSASEVDSICIFPAKITADVEIPIIFTAIYLKNGDTIKKGLYTYPWQGDFYVYSYTYDILIDAVLSSVAPDRYPIPTEIDYVAYRDTFYQKQINMLKRSAL